MVHFTILPSFSVIIGLGYTHKGDDHTGWSAPLLFACIKSYKTMFFQTNALLKGLICNLYIRYYLKNSPFTCK